MEPSCPLYFPLYPPDHLLPGLKEYLEDPTPLLAALEHRLPTDSSKVWTKRAVQETSSSGSRNRLVVGSRKLVFLHSTTSKWCRMKMGSSSGRKEKVKGGKNGWSKKGRLPKQRSIFKKGRFSKKGRLPKQRLIGKECLIKKRPIAKTKADWQ